MARGRMITNNITRDKDIHNLSDDTCRLLFTWLLTFADCEGRTYGDPAIVKSTVYPRRTDITVDQVDGYLEELSNVGLILRYSAGDDLFILFPAFDKNQPGLRKDREPASDFPPPPDEAIDKYVRMFAGKKPDVCRMLDGLREEKRREEKGKEGSAAELAELTRAYEKNVGVLSGMLREMLADDLDEYGLQLCLDAMAEGVRNNKRKWSYVQGILKNWKRDGRGASVGTNGKTAKPKSRTIVHPDGTLETIDEGGL